MKKTGWIGGVVAFTWLAIIAPPAMALTVPTAEDASSTIAGTITTGTGKAVSLPVNAKQTAFVRFNLSTSAVVPPAVTAENVVSARLRLWITSVTKPGDLYLYAVTSAWTETPANGKAAQPAINTTPFAVIPASQVVKKNFVSVDVTAAVRAAIGVTDYGFAIQAAAPLTRVALASKEGAATGYAAELDIETAPVAEENLRMIRGVVSGAAGILAGAGFTASKGAAGSGQYSIAFNTPFSGPPTVTATADLDGRIISTAGVTAYGANFQISVAGGGHTDAAFHVIVVGPR